MRPFDGKVVWITGGGTGIGRSLALELARQGAQVAVSGRRQDRLDEVVAACEALGRPALAVPCDVRDEAACQAAVQAILERFGVLDVCVANAGYGVVGKVEQLTDAQWRAQFDVNVFGVLNTVRAALPQLKLSRGRVALISSVAVFANPRRNAAYNASKAAVAALGATLWAELHGSGVSCTTIYPGLVHSEIGQVDNQGVYHPEKKDPRPQAVMWTSEKAARVMADAIADRRRELVFTGHGKLIALVARLFPGVMARLALKS